MWYFIIFDDSYLFPYITSIRNTNIWYKTNRAEISKDRAIHPFPLLEPYIDIIWRRIDELKNVNVFVSYNI